MKGNIMNATSLNNLWTYLQGVLTVDDKKWLGDKLLHATTQVDNDSSIANKQKYRLSPRRKKLMNSIVVNPRDFEGDDRAQYILGK